MRIPLATLLILTAITLQGCAVNRPQSERISKDSFDVESVEEQAVQAVRAAPTEFTVPLTEDRHAWERAKLFFHSYLKSDPLEEMLASGTSVLASRPAQRTSYRYQIERSYSAFGARYRVICAARNSGAAAQAVQNAKNLSRFIRDGNLERSLLIQ